MAKREVMRSKGKLRGRKERIEDDLTWKERKMQWRIREMGEEEEGKGKRVRVSYGKIAIDGKMWFCDERGEVLRDWRWREKEREDREGGEGATERKSQERGKTKTK